jgi:hypothetical protein
LLKEIRQDNLAERKGLEPAFSCSMSRGAQIAENLAEYLNICGWARTGCGTNVEVVFDRSRFCSSTSVSYRWSCLATGARVILLTMEIPPPRRESKVVEFLKFRENGGRFHP